MILMILTKLLMAPCHLTQLLILLSSKCTLKNKLKIEGIDYSVNEESILTVLMIPLF